MQVALLHFGSTAHPNVAAKLREYRTFLASAGSLELAFRLDHAQVPSDIRRVRSAVHNGAIPHEAFQLSIGDRIDLGYAPTF